MGTFGSPPVVDPPVVVSPAVVSPAVVTPEGAVVEVPSEPDPLVGPAVPDPPDPGPLVPGSMFFVSPTELVHPADSRAARSKPVDPLVAMSFIVSPASLRGP